MAFRVLPPPPPPPQQPFESIAATDCASGAEFGMNRNHECIVKNPSERTSEENYQGAERPSGGRVWEGGVPLLGQEKICILSLKKQFLMHILGKDY